MLCDDDGNYGSGGGDDAERVRDGTHGVHVSGDGGGGQQLVSQGRGGRRHELAVAGSRSWWQSDIFIFRHLLAARHVGTETRGVGF
jgi:hypothetical protein